jgi:hypothetical protein
MRVEEPTGKAGRSTVRGLPATGDAALDNLKGEKQEGEPDEAAEDQNERPDFAFTSQPQDGEATASRRAYTSWRHSRRKM